MGVIQSDLCFYGSADMPDGDGVTTGGAVDFSTRIFFSDDVTGKIRNFATNGGNTTSLQISGFDGNGNLVTETIASNATSTTTFSHILKGVAGLATPISDFAAIPFSSPIISSHTLVGAGNSTSTTPAYAQLQSGDGALISIGQILFINSGVATRAMRRIIGIDGDTVYLNRDWDGAMPGLGDDYFVYVGMLFDLLPNPISQIRRPFYNASADFVTGTSRTFYEKIFAVNNNTTFGLSSANISKTVDPVGAAGFEFALCDALNDTGTVANRQTAPATGITAFTTGAAPQTLLVPSPQNLPNGAAPNAAGAQGIWLRLQLNPGQGGQFTFGDMKISGGSL